MEGILGRKYLEELGIESKDTPWGWNDNDNRQKYWYEQIKEYGFAFEGKTVLIVD